MVHGRMHQVSLYVVVSTDLGLSFYGCVWFDRRCPYNQPVWQFAWMWWWNSWEVFCLKVSFSHQSNNQLPPLTLSLQVLKVKGHKRHIKSQISRTSLWNNQTPKKAKSCLKGVSVTVGVSPWPPTCPWRPWAAPPPLYLCSWRSLCDAELLFLTLEM